MSWRTSPHLGTPEIFGRADGTLSALRIDQERSKAYSAWKSPAFTLGKTLLGFLVLIAASRRVRGRMRRRSLAAGGGRPRLDGRVRRRSTWGVHHAARIGDPGLVRRMRGWGAGGMRRRGIGGMRRRVVGLMRR